MPDVPSAPDEVARLRAANARLRQVAEAKDTEIAALRTSHQAQLGALRMHVSALSAEVADLRARLGQNPRNSSKPPSSEGLGKPAPKSLRKKSGRKPGRPKGQPGARLQTADHPDEAVTHEPGRCAGCGAGLLGAPVTGTERRQVTDLPEVIRAVVTEHRIISRRCSCGTVTSGAAAEGVTAPMQHGLAETRHRYHSAVLIGKNQSAARAGPLMRKHHALARRLLAREDDYLRFTTNSQVPFDNNAAEREIRMSKLRIKVSGCMRSMAGAENFCAIRSYLSTAAKHSISKLDALTRAATGIPWAPETA